jgi:hypothetical protein
LSLGQASVKVAATDPKGTAQFINSGLLRLAGSDGRRADAG